jgi:hypothetical protein
MTLNDHVLKKVEGTTKSAVLSKSNMTEAQKAQKKEEILEKLTMVQSNNQTNVSLITAPHTVNATNDKTVASVPELKDY